ncbi:hypothetical protein LUZ61_012193 [Rhynchospora tenuis]|uniref:Cytochrome P450 n=1 Tax=Rhynchospora tenuis TaxID=198213 RepID=A0AAD6A2X1_9POAL|nr:hypothetical protein LUZ61_012193 [Rhynchospora tenuis]
MELLQLVAGVAVGALLVYQVLLRWNEIWYQWIVNKSLPLPPGTMGWPLIGENISFQKLGPDFIADHQRRYGNMFKTHLFGNPVVVCTDSDVNKYVLTSESKGILLGYPRTFSEILGKWSTFSLYGSEHKAMRGILISLVAGPALRERILPKIDEFMKSYLSNWSDKILDFEKKSDEKENLEIRKGKAEDYTINWDDYNSMSFTRAVVLEALRMASAGIGFLRKTTVDTKIKGYIIPKGWTLLLRSVETNKDTDTYAEPLKFNPWRWLESNLESHQYFMLFGGGERLCPAKEFGVLQISMFLHYLVTRYRWEEVGENKIVRFPHVEAPNGLYYRFRDC